MLVVVVGIYCLIMTADRMIGHWRVLHGQERHWGFARKYLVVQLLRLGWRDVRREVLQIAFWLGMLATLIWAHRFVGVH